MLQKICSRITSKLPGLRSKRLLLSAAALLLAVNILLSALPVAIFQSAGAAEPVCELTEHVHTQDCYELVCGESAIQPASDSDAAGHTHSEGCYELVCSITEHEHIDTCYQTEEEPEEPEAEAESATDAAPEETLAAAPAMLPLTSYKHTDTLDQTEEEAEEPEAEAESATDAAPEETLEDAPLMLAMASAVPELGAPQITFTSSVSTVSFELSANDTVYVDWGDGNIVEEDNQIYGEVLGTVKVYSNGDITEIRLYYSGLTSLDVSNCTALTYLDCYNNQLTALDVSNNAALYELNCEVNQLTELDVSNNAALFELDCSANQLTALDVSNCTALTHLYCDYNQLTALNVCNNTALTHLYCDSNQLIELDVSKNTVLHTLFCDENQLTALDVSKNTALYELNCVINQLTALDVSNNTELGVLRCYSNQLTELDVTNNLKLVTLHCGGDQLTELDVSKCTELRNLGCDASQLTALDVSCNTALETLTCEFNHIAELDVSNNPQLIMLWCSLNDLSELDVSANPALIDFQCNENQLTFADLAPAKVFEERPNFEYYNNYNYSPQAPVTIPAQTFTGNTVDLSSEYNANDTETVYTWFDAANDTPLATQPTNNGGVFTFGASYEGKTVYCTMTNASLPELTLTTMETAVVAAAPEVGAPQITFTSSNSTIDFRLTTNDTVYVDWGDGNIVEEGNRVNGTVLGTVKVYCNGDITEISTRYSPNGLTSLDVSNCTALTSLDCSGNQLTELDVSNCTALTSLDCANNQLTKLDVSNCTALTYLSCERSQLTELDVTNNTSLEYLGCSYNRLTELDVTNNTSLEYLGCSGNRLAKLDVTNNTNLEQLWCSGNRLAKLDVTPNTNLVMLVCADNQLSELNVSKNPLLGLFWCSDNKLTKLDVTNNPLLSEFECHNNQLTSLDLSNNKNLVSVLCHNNQIDTLNFVPTVLPVDHYYATNGFHFENNRLTFNDLFEANEINDLFADVEDNNSWYYDLEYQEYPNYIYSPQAPVLIPAQTFTGKAVDLSSEYNANGTETIYTWYDAANDTPLATQPTNNGGVFTFGAGYLGKTLYCTMTNASLPELTLTTTETAVMEFVVENNTDDGDLVDEVKPSNDAEFSVKDGNISGLKLIVGNVEGNNKKTVIEAVENYNKAFDADEGNYALYDISLENENGVKVEVVEGRLQITLKIPDNLPGNAKDYTFKLYHYDEDIEKLEEIPITLSNGNSHYTFFADDFSPYMLVYYLTEETIEIPQITVTYAWMDGKFPEGAELPPAEKINAGDAYTAAAPAKKAIKDQAFSGWYTDSKCTTKFIDGTKLTADTTLYGKWTVQTSSSGEKSNTGDSPKTGDTANTELNVILALNLLLISGYVVYYYLQKQKGMTRFIRSLKKSRS